MKTAILRRGKEKTVQEETEKEKSYIYLGKSDPTEAKGKEF